MRYLLKNYIIIILVSNIFFGGNFVFSQTNPKKVNVKLENKKIVKSGSVIDGSKLIESYVVFNKHDILSKSVLFDVNSYKLNKKAIHFLDSFITKLKSKPPHLLILRAYADTTGSIAYNKKLSANRCETVANYLKSKNIPAKDIRVQSFGETRKYGTKDNYLNRRVEINIRKKRIRKK